MAIFLATVAIVVAVAALLTKHPSKLQLDRLELVNGPDRTRIEPGRIEIERDGVSCIGLSILNDGPYIVGNVEKAFFRLGASDSAASLLVKGGDGLASILSNGITVQNAATQSVLLPRAMMPGLPITAGDEPATIESKPPMIVKPLAALAKLRAIHNPHGLKIHEPVDEPTIVT
jgi:hypothetical protein